MAPVPLPPPTASSAAESSPIEGQAGALWAQLEQSWTQVARLAGLNPPEIRSHLNFDLPPDARNLESSDGNVTLHRAPGEWWFRYPDDLACRVAAGNPPVIGLKNHTHTSLQQFTRLAGPLTAMLMDVCGFYPLHACGLVLRSRMFAVHGGSGSGKSTLAAIMASAGIAVAGDDLLPLNGSGQIVGIGGSLRVMPDHAPRDWQPLAHLPDGRGWYSLPPLATVPLAAILLLERGPRIQVEPVRGKERLRAVVRCGFLSHMDPSPAADWHERIIEVAGQVGVLRLVVPDTLNALRDSREQLKSALEDLAE